MVQKDKKCVFCEIINGDRTASIVYKDDVCHAFLDYRPVYKGHVLLVPNRHVETVMDLPDSLIGPFFERVKLISQAVEIAIETDGIFNAINNRMSQSVPHIHVHIIPRRHKDNMRHFLWPRMKYENDEETKHYRTKIAETAQKLQSGAHSWDFMHELVERLNNFPQELEKSEYQQPLDQFIREQRKLLSGSGADQAMSLGLFSSKDKVKTVLTEDKLLATLFLKDYVLSKR